MVCLSESIMKFLILCCLVLIVSANKESSANRNEESSSKEFCYNDVTNSCRVGGTGGNFENCNANYCGIKSATTLLNEYIQHHIGQSFEYLQMSINFANYKTQREGFAKLFRKLSDSAWDDAIHLMKYLTKRGEAVTFDTHGPLEPNRVFRDSVSYEMSELSSLGRALDSHKLLAKKAQDIHLAMIRHSQTNHDAETTSFIEEQFVHKHAEVIRELSGHTNDLAKFIHEARDASLSIFLFDEYLKSIV